MSEEKDLLEIKIEQAKLQLSEETLKAISSVDWKQSILGMREKRGYTFEQLGDLEIETELLLCGLLSPTEYPKELEKQMGISKNEASELVKEMNILVFEKIKQEMIKIVGRQKMFSRKEIIPKKETPMAPAATSINPSAPVGNNTKQDLHPILAEKFAGSIAMAPRKTEYSLTNISKSGSGTVAPTELSVPQAPKTTPQMPPASSAKVMTGIKPATASEAKVSPSYVKNRDPYRLSPED